MSSYSKTFSGLNFVKTKHISSMKHVRLEDLLTISIEQECLPLLLTSTM